MKFVKKPVEIEARELKIDNVASILDWVGRSGTEVKRRYDHQGFPDGIIILTLEGNHAGEFGDYIIMGVEGEFYPCKPGIFKKTYKEVV